MLGRGRMLEFTSVFEQLRPNTGSFRTQSRALVTPSGPKTLAVFAPIPQLLSQRRIQ
jgi:hypothetical protein